MKGGSMLYRLMIVDDEEAIREGIANSIPWAEWGFSVVARCANGEEAIMQIEQTKPDIVLSDIRMPKMDGVELMSYLNRNYPEIKILILSGYSDFEYLNMSIKNKVTEYLLKPTDLDEFEEVFCRLKKTLDEEKQSREQQNHKEQLLFFAWLDKLLRGRSTSGENEIFAPQTTQYSVWLENSAVVVFAVDDLNQDQQALLQMRNCIAEIASACGMQQGKCPFFVTSEDAVTGIYGTHEENELEYDEIFDFIKQVQQAVKAKGGFTVSAGISELCTEPQMLPQAYEQAKCCAKQNVFCGNESVFRYSQLEEEIPQKAIYFRTEELEKALLSQKNEDIHQELQRVFSMFRQHPLKEYRYVDQLCLSCLFELSRWALRYNVRMEKLLNKAEIAYSNLYHCQTLDSKCEFMEEILNQLQKEIEHQRDSNRKSNSVAYQVRRLADEEFGSNAMSLEYIAGKVHKSPAYISKVFKNELNCNFIDYITKLRMEYAAKLLANNDNPKIYEIAAECGYADVSNFIKVFRKYHQQSPNEYRNSLQRNSR